MDEYTNVRVSDLYHQYLNNGTAYADGDPNHLTYIECETFQGKMPAVGNDYIIAGEDGRWALNKHMICTYSGPQSRFRIRQANGTTLAEGGHNALEPVTSVQFFVTNNTNGQLANQAILVFLTPLLSSSNYMYAAWQQLTPGEGSTQPFILSQDISGSVITQNGTISNEMLIAPGYLSSATNPQGLSPVLSSPTYSDKVTSQQAGIENDTSPFTPLDTNWYVNSQLVVTSNIPLTSQALSTFQLQTRLYWAVGAVQQGANYTLSEITPMQNYDLPAGVSSVKVNVTYNQTTGQYQFTFNPSDASQRQETGQLVVSR